VKRFNAFFLLLILFSTLLHAKPEREMININFKGLEIEEFISLISRIMHKNILITSPIKGKVDFITTEPVAVNDVDKILIAVLETKGFTLVDQGTFMEVVRSAEASKHNLPIYNKQDAIKERESAMITKQIYFEDLDVDLVSAKVRHLLSKTAKLITIKASNSLLITDYPKNIESVQAVLNQIKRDSQKVVKTVPLNHAQLKTIFPKIVEITKTLFNPQSVKVMKHDELNAVVIMGYKASVARVRDHIKRLDKKERYSSQTTEIIALKNSDAKSVQASLKEIIEKQHYPDPALKPSISANETINSIILIGSHDALKPIKSIIAVLDKEKYQVYVKARIVEIRDSLAKQIGIKYGIDGGVGNSSGLYTFAMNLGGAALAPVNSTLSSKFTDSVGNINKGLALGAAIDFLQKNGASNTVSEPSLLCVNNQESSIYVGKTQSFQSGQVDSGATGTTSSFKREDIGLTLQVKPRISDNAKVTLDVEAKLENVTGQDANGQPITTKQTVKTQIISNHGESVVIGGLIKQFENNDESKVPLLGDIPVLGELFKHTDRTKDNDHLLVLLTPYIVTSSEKLSELQENLGRLGKIQKQYNDQVFSSLEKPQKSKSIVTVEETLSTTMDEEIY
jgi:general secretion pathway protein D